nr:hypothetical protein REQ54_04309 [Rhizobium sp. Q54]
MTNGSDGRFAKEEVSTIRAAHQQWCQEHLVEPQSKDGLDAAAAMIAMYQSGKIWKHELVSYNPGSRSSPPDLSAES